MGILIKFNGIYLSTGPVFETKTIFDEIKKSDTRLLCFIDGNLEFTHPLFSPDGNLINYEFEDENGSKLEIEVPYIRLPPTVSEQAQAAALLAARTLGLVPEIEQQAEAMQVIVEAAGLAGDTSPDGDWQPDEYVTVGDKRVYNSQVYICRQAHVTQADWMPDLTAALWEVERSGTEWQQPAPGTSGYGKGDTVTHNGKTWVSDVDNNVWEPGAFGVYTWVLAE